MYKTNYKSFLSLSCLPVCSHNFLLLFFSFFYFILLRSSFLRISSPEHAQRSAPFAIQLYFITRIDGTCDRETHEEQGRVGLVAEAPSEESRRKRS